MKEAQPMAPDPDPDISKGEKQTPRWSYQFVDLTRIEAGELLAPAKIDSVAAREFAALQLISSDLAFSLECFREANKIGVPDAQNIHSKALIFSGVVAYARPFKTSVREVRLDDAFFGGLGAGFSLELHNYLIAVRDKHVAHSVNEFERCEATALMVGSADQKHWRVAGIGFTQNVVIGVSRSLVEQAIAQVSNMLLVLTADLDRRKVALFEEFRARFDQDGKWEMAPLASFPQRDNVSKRRGV